MLNSSRKRKTDVIAYLFFVGTLTISILFLCFSLTANKAEQKERYDVIEIETPGGLKNNGFLSDALDSLGDINKKLILDPRTLEIDYDKRRIETCKLHQRRTKNGCKVADIMTLSAKHLAKMSTRKIRGNTFWHVLNRAPTCDIAEKMWIKVASLVKSFSSFVGPAHDRELSAVGEEPTGYHRTWENWHSGTCHFNSTMLERSMKATSKTTAYIIMNYGRIDSTDSDIILPKGASGDSSHYDPLKHPPKESFSLVEYELYENMFGCAIYDNIEKKRKIPLYSALCIRHVLRGPKDRGLKMSKVVACSFGNYTGLECVHMLSIKVMETLESFYKADDKGLRNIAL